MPNSSPTEPNPEDLPGEPFSMPAPGYNGPRTWGVLGFLVFLAAAYCIYMVGIMGGRRENHPVPVTAVAGPALRPVNPMVHVSGRVVKPGVYTLAPEARVQDAVRRAGGPLPDADINALNLADWVQDGGKIFVPSKNRPKPAPPASPARKKPGTTKNVVNKPRAKAKAASTPRPRPVPTPVPTPLRPFNLNGATEAEMDLLPGVGPVMAAEIVALRTSRGYFRSVDELQDVPGIGPKKLDRIRPYLFVE